jgi:hypothetical protein
MNSNIEEINKYNLLYDFYAELLTKKQKEIFVDYFQNDYSICEIAEKKNVSRQFIYEMISKTKKIFDKMEKKLSLLKKYKQRKNNIDNFFKYINSLNINSRIKKNIFEYTEKTFKGI